MPNNTFLQLQTALASMWGYNDPAELLDQDLVDIKAWINAAYFDCFAPVDGSRAWWPEQNHSDIIKAPVVAALTFIQGSKVVSGYAFEDKYAGSYVRVGDKWFRYAGKIVTAGPVTTYYLVEPWADADGTFDATIYHNAVALPWNVVETAGKPTILGLGALEPMPGPDGETTLRTAPSVDFSPEARFARNRFTQAWNYYDVGDPRWYFIDQSSVSPVFAIGNRFHVFPIPENVFTFTLRACIVPLALDANGDIPTLPAQSVDNILLPIAKERLAENTTGRRYTGPLQPITRAADRARAQLKSMHRTQRDTASRMRLSPRW